MPSVGREKAGQGEEDEGVERGRSPFVSRTMVAPFSVSLHIFSGGGSPEPRDFFE